MRLHSLHQKARLSAASAIEQLRHILAKSAEGTVTQQLDLSELEDRILLSASPAAVMVESALAAESVQFASPLGGESASLFQSSQVAISPISPAQEDGTVLVSGGSPIVEEAAGETFSAAEPSIERTATEVIFIDESADDFEQLVADLESQRDAGRAIDFFVLDSQQDGIDQIAETLERYSDLDAVHIVSHGTSGAVKLGATWLRIGSLDAYAGTIAGWGSAVGTEGDILFYGCDLASNTRGEMLVDSIAALTGADVAASTDDTGHAIYGGDWDLEYATGTVESQLAFSADVQQNWNGLLAVITVDTFNDLVDGGDTTDIASLIATPGTDGISLREAIIAANNTAGADDIFVGAGTYTLSIAGQLEDASATGDLDILGDLTITGAGAGSTIIDGGGLDRVIDVRSGVANISDVTVQGGNNGTGNGGGIDVGGSADLTLVDSWITGNNAFNGAGLHVVGVLTVDRVTVSGNTALNDGGGFSVTGGGSGLALTNVTVSGNSAVATGGAIRTNSSITVTNSTIAFNSASNAGGIGVAGSGNATLQNTILSNNTGGNANNALTSLGNNIDSDSTAGLGDPLDGVDPLLEALQDNGGPTFTHALLPGSSAIDAGTTSGAPAVDQRGITRDASPDIGAYEFSVSLTATGELLVNTTTTDIQETSAEDRGSQQAVSLAADGSYVVVWTSLNQDGSGEGVYARRFDSTGAALTPELQVHQSPLNDQQWARVASAADGTFVVTWTSNHGANVEDIYFRRFAADGTALTGETLVNTSTTGVQKNSVIGMNQTTGDFVIVWQGNGTQTGEIDADGIFGQRFDGSGAAIGGEFRVNANTANIQYDAAVSVNDSGAFVVTWEDSAGFHFQRFDNAATEQGGQVTVDGSISAGNGAVAMHSDDSFVVTWRKTVLDEGVYARRYDSSGTPLSSEAVVNTSTVFNQTNPSIAMDSSGDYIIVWEGFGSGDNSGVFGRKYDSSGTALTGEFLVNNTTTNTQSQASVAILDIDNYVVVWSGEGAGDIDGVFARQFSDIPPVLDLDADNSSGASGSDFNAAFVDGAGPVAVVDTDATLSDVNSTNLKSLTVTITDRQDFTDEILAADTSGTSIVASFNSFAGVLTLSGTDTVANYQQVLRTITYDNATIPATGTSRSITIVANDGVVNSNIGTTSMSVNASPNQLPTAAAGGPYVINEGDSLNLVGSASSDPDTDPLTYAWDLDNDGNFGEVGEPTTETPAVSWATLQSFGIDDDGVYTIGVEVSDGKGGLDTATTTITVNNVAPTLSTTGTGNATANSLYTLNLGATDPGNDTIASWTINWGDGTIEAITGNPASVTHTYTTTAIGFTYNILASASDEDGTYFQNELLVASSNNDSVIRYGADGSFLQQFAIGDGIDYPVDPIIGPDGNLYLSGWNSDNVLRYNATTGAFIDTFVTAGSGGLSSAAGLAFGPDGNLYVASRLTSEVLRFNGTTGAFIDAFVTAASGGLNEAEGLTFGPDGNLYVSDYQNNAVYKYHGTTGAFQAVFVTSGSGGLGNAEDLAFGPDGNLYIADDTNSSVHRYNGTTGAYINDFVTSGSGGLTNATGVAFGPDGNLYVGSWGTDSVLRYSGTTGAFIDAYITSGSGGLQSTDYLNFLPEHQVTVTAPANTAPVISSNGGGATAAVNVAENATAVTTVIATDTDLPAQTLTYSVSGGADAAKFAINSSTGVLTFALAPDFETPTDVGTDNIYNVTVQVTDGTLTDTQAIAVTVTPVTDNTPTITSNGGGASAAVNVAENSTAVTTVNASDADLPAETLTYSISGGADAAKFAINSSTGVLTFALAPDFETPTDVGTDNIYNVTVQVSDGTLTDTQAIAVTVTPVTDNTPTITSNGGGASAAVNVAENSTAVTTVTAADADLPAETLTYSISGGADAAKFAINSSTGVLTFATAPDFETPTDSGTDNVYNVTVQVSDGTLTDTQAIAVTVTPVTDNAPTITSNGGGVSAAINVAENTTAITTVTATDPDLPAQTLTYSISGGADATKFAINASTGVLTFVSTPDFETPTDIGTDNVYDVTVQVSDGTLIDTQAIAVTVTAGNDNTPVVTPAQSFNVSESATNGTSLGTVVASDADAGTTFSNWTITGGNAAGVFGINAATGELTIVDRTNLDFETTPGYVLSVTVSDGVNTSSVETVAITVLDQNDETPVVTPGQSFNVSESATNGTSLGTVVASDADAGTTFSNWTITGGNAAGVFGINAATGELTIVDRTNLDFETTPSYVLSVTVSDGVNTSSVETVAITVLDQNDETPVVTPSQSFNVSESATNGTPLGTVVATDADADAGTTFTNWTITGGNAAGVFGINAATGALTVVDRTSLNFETTPSYVLSVTVSDGVNTSSVETIAITVLDQNDETPVVTPAQSFNVSESATNGTSLGTVVATDADAGTTFSNWTITSGNAAGVFGINASTGALTIVDRTNLNFETTPGYVLSVTVRDGVNTSSVETVAITVLDQNDETPVVTPAQSFNVSESATNGTSLGTVVATDADAGTTFSNWTITGGDPAGVFAINASTGQITIADNSTLDFDSVPASYALSVTASDGTNTSAAETVTINLIDVNESPVVTTSSGSASFTEGLGPLAIDSALTVSDPENAGLTGAEVRFDSGFVTGQDRLLFTNQAGISGSYNATTGVLTLSGPASVADYETALRTVSYDNSSQSPNAANRVIRFTVDDGTNTSSATRTLTVTPQDDPANVVPGGPYAVTEGGSVLLDGSASSDADNVIVEYEWDFDYDGVTFAAGATGASTAFSAASIDGPTVRTVALRTRSDNGAFAIATTTVTISNAAPTANADSGTAFTTDEGSSFVTGNVLSNDNDPGPETLIVSSIDATGTIGLVVDRGDGTFTYDPNGQFESLAAGQSANDTFTYTVSDGTATDTATVTIVITGVNDAPTLNDQNVNVDENASLNSLVATATATDVDSGDSVSWSIISGDPNDAFTIDALSGEIRVAKPLEFDFESTPNYSLTVRAIDQQGGIGTGTVSVSLNDLNESPTISGATFSVAEDAAPGTGVGFAAGSDPDAGDTLIWSILGGNTNGAFSMSASTGELTVANPSTLDFETIPSYTLTVQLRDAVGLTDTSTLVVKVSDINETPTTTGLADVTVNEDSVNVLIDLTTAFADTETPSALLGYSVTGNSNPALFAATSISGGVLTLDFAANLNGAATITVEATDPQGLTVSTSFAVTVLAVNDAPVAFADSYSVDGQTLSVSATAGVLANDTDVEADTLTALLISGPANGSLTLQSDGSFVYELEIGFKGTESFSYQTFDGAATSATRIVTLNVIGNAVVAPSAADPGPSTNNSSDSAEVEADTEADDATVESSVDSSTTEGVANQSAPSDGQPEATVAAETDSDDEGNEVIASDFGMTETSQDFFAMSSERLELRDATNVRTSVSALDRSADASTETKLNFQDSLRFAGEDLSYLVGTEFIKELEKVEEDFTFHGTVPEWAAGTAVATTASISVGYIMWMLRGGYVLASVLSTMPVWQNIDPLPVLAALDDADEDDSLETMIDRASHESDDSETQVAAEATDELRKEGTV